MLPRVLASLAAILYSVQLLVSRALTPFVEWWEDFVLGTWEEAVKTVIRESFANINRFVNGAAAWVVSWFDRTYYQSLKLTWNEQHAWQHWWEEQRQSTLNAIVERSSSLFRQGSGLEFSVPNPWLTPRSSSQTFAPGLQGTSSSSTLERYLSFNSEVEPALSNATNLSQSFSTDPPSRLPSAAAITPKLSSSSHTRSAWNSQDYHKQQNGSIHHRKAAHRTAATQSWLSVPNIIIAVWHAFWTLLGRRQSVRKPGGNSQTSARPHAAPGGHDVPAARQNSRTLAGGLIVNGNTPGPGRRSYSNLFQKSSGLMISETVKRTGLLEDVRINVELFVTRIFAAIRSALHSSWLLPRPVESSVPPTPGRPWSSAAPRGRSQMRVRLPSGKPDKLRRSKSQGRWEPGNPHHTLTDLSTTGDLIRLAGYSLEEHTVETKDGYILSMQRIPRVGSRNVVFFMHGVLDTSMGWVTQGVTGSQAFTAWDRGFDVWLGNTRCNPPRLRKPGARNPYWSFSNNEVALYDIGAQVDHIHVVKTAEFGAACVHIDPAASNRCSTPCIRRCQSDPLLTELQLSKQALDLDGPDWELLGAGSDDEQNKSSPGGTHRRRHVMFQTTDSLAEDDVHRLPSSLARGDESTQQPVHDAAHAVPNGHIAPGRAVSSPRCRTGMRFSQSGKRRNSCATGKVTFCDSATNGWEEGVWGLCGSEGVDASSSFAQRIPTEPLKDHCDVSERAGSTAASWAGGMMNQDEMINDDQNQALHRTPHATYKSDFEDDVKKRVRGSSRNPTSSVHETASCNGTHRFQVEQDDCLERLRINQFPAGVQFSTQHALSNTSAEQGNECKSTTHAGGQGSVHVGGSTGTCVACQPTGSAPSNNAAMLPECSIDFEGAGSSVCEDCWDGGQVLGPLHTFADDTRDDVSTHQSDEGLADFTLSGDSHVGGSTEGDGKSLMECFTDDDNAEQHCRSANQEPPHGSSNMCLTRGSAACSREALGQSLDLYCTADWQGAGRVGAHTADQANGILTWNSSSPDQAGATCPLGLPIARGAGGHGSLHPTSADPESASRLTRERPAGGTSTSSEAVDLVGSSAHQLQEGVMPSTGVCSQTSHPSSSHTGRHGEHSSLPSDAIDISQSRQIPNRGGSPLPPSTPDQLMQPRASQGELSSDDEQNGRMQHKREWALDCGGPSGQVFALGSNGCKRPQQEWVEDAEGSCESAGTLGSNSSTQSAVHHCDEDARSNTGLERSTAIGVSSTGQPQQVWVVNQVAECLGDVGCNGNAPHLEKSACKAPSRKHRVDVLESMSSPSSAQPDGSQHASIEREGSMSGSTEQDLVPAAVKKQSPFAAEEVQHGCETGTAASLGQQVHPEKAGTPSSSHSVCDVMNCGTTNHSGQDGSDLLSEHEGSAGAAAKLAAVCKAAASTTATVVAAAGVTTAAALSAAASAAAQALSTAPSPHHGASHVRPAHSQSTDAKMVETRKSNTAASKADNLPARRAADGSEASLAGILTFTDDAATAAPSLDIAGEIKARLGMLSMKPEAADPVSPSCPSLSSSDRAATSSSPPPIASEHAYLQGQRSQPPSATSPSHGFDARRLNQPISHERTIHSAATAQPQVHFPHQAESTHLPSGTSHPLSHLNAAQSTPQISNIPNSCPPRAPRWFSCPPNPFNIMGLPNLFSSSKLQYTSNKPPTYHISPQKPPLPGTQATPCPPLHHALTATHAAPAPHANHTGEPSTSRVATSWADASSAEDGEGAVSSYTVNGDGAHDLTQEGVMMDGSGAKAAGHTGNMFAGSTAAGNEDGLLPGKVTPIKTKVKQPSKAGMGLSRSRSETFKRVASIGKKLPSISSMPQLDSAGLQSAWRQSKHESYVGQGRKLRGEQVRSSPVTKSAATTPATLENLQEWDPSTQPQPYKLQAVGHSLGGAVLLMYTVMQARAGRPHHLSRLILLTPAGFHTWLPAIAAVLSRVVPPLVRLIRLFWRGFNAALFIPTFVARMLAFKLMLDQRRIPALAALLRLLAQGVFNGDISQWERAMQMPHYSANDMPAVSLHQVLHMMQWSLTQQFRLFDYGSSTINIHRYGTALPPSMCSEYWRINIPVDLMAGIRDGIIPAGNVRLHYKKMQEAGVAVTYKEFDYGHLDFTFASKEELQHYVMARLSRHATRQRDL